MNKTLTQQEATMFIFSKYLNMKSYLRPKHKQLFGVCPGIVPLKLNRMNRMVRTFHIYMQYFFFTEPKYKYQPLK